MNLTIHRGTHEIGGTCVELATKNTRIIIDVGLPFKLPSGEDIDLEEVYRLPPKELIEKSIVKDVPGLYSWDKDRKPPDAILITHPHLDHFGLLPFVKPTIPLYMSKGTKLMIGKVSNLFNKIDQDLNDVRLLKAWEPFDFKDFNITPFLADHAGFDARGFLIEADKKRVFYTGDFRGHGKKAVSFERMIEDPPENIDYLITEGTQIENGDTPYNTEDDIENAIVDILQKTKGLVFISFSSQNIDRIVAIYNACSQAKRVFVIDPCTAYVLDVAKELSPNIPHARFDPFDTFRIFYAKGKHSNILAEKELLFGFPKKARISYDEIAEKKNRIAVRDTSFIRKRFKAKGFLDDAVMVWSQYDGYLKEDEKALWNKAGIPILPVHVSGHATLKELQRIITTLDPNHIIPFHTSAPDKFRELFGERVMVLSDGERIEL